MELYSLICKPLYHHLFWSNFKKKRTKTPPNIRFCPFLEMAIPFDSSVRLLLIYGPDHLQVNYSWKWIVDWNSEIVKMNNNSDKEFFYKEWISESFVEPWKHRAESFKSELWKICTGLSTVGWYSQIYSYNWLTAAIQLYMIRSNFFKVLQKIRRFIHSKKFFIHFYLNIDSSKY